VIRRTMPRGDINPKGYGAKPSDSFVEIGTKGLKTFFGEVFEESLRQLRGSKGRKIYSEMRDNDETIGAIMFAIEMIIRGISWQVDPAKDIEGELSSEEAEDSATWLSGVLFEDMSHDWNEFIAEQMSMFTYGWAYFEIVFKLRQGPDKYDPSRRSNFEDGKIGIRKLSIRSQDTLDRWQMDDEDGGLDGMWQLDPNKFQYYYIPIEKALLFRPHPYRGNPEGRSVLRNAYRPWYFKKIIEQIESIGIERELNGLPVVRVPSELIKKANEGDADATTAINSYTKLVRDVKFNEQGGALLPSDPWYDEEGKPTNLRQVDLELLTAGGKRAIDTNEVIKRYQLGIARSVLADFIMLGTDSKGSHALSKDKTGLFIAAMDGWLNSITSVINRHLIPRLWQMNVFSREIMPVLNHGNVTAEDVKILVDAVKGLAAAGMPLFPEPGLEEHMRDRLGLPANSGTEEE
jgi:hypothetical protein